jgi:hypothetical protein
VEVSLLKYDIGNPYFNSTGYVSAQDAGGAEYPVILTGGHGIDPGWFATSYYRIGHYYETIRVDVPNGACGWAWVSETTGVDVLVYSQAECINLSPSTCPIVIDLQGDGFHFSGLEDAVWFDIDGDLIPDEIGWTAAGSLDGFLVLDRNGNGIVDDGGELFGNATPLGSGGNAANGYEALAELDRSENGGNEDGRIDQADEQFRRLRIWLDLNHDGRSTASELKPLHAHGIESIPVTYVDRPITDEYGNVLVFFNSVSLLGGSSDSTILSTDVFFVRGDG